MSKKQFLLEGLNCVNCAAKIEREVNGLAGIKANMNFMNKTLVLESEAEIDDDYILNQVKKIVKKHEPEVSVKEKGQPDVKPSAEYEVRGCSHENGCELNLDQVFDESHSHGHNHDDGEEGGRKKEIIKLVAGGIIFLIGVLFTFQNWLELVVFLVSYFIVGGHVVLRAAKEILHGEWFSENFLMSIATIGAFFVGEYPEGVAVMLFYLVGELFQDMAVDNSRRSISALMDIRPDYANLKTGDGLTKVSPEEVKIGDVIVVKPGERVPLDGKVIEGSSMVDTAALTGESVPRELNPGSDALSGFINKNGVLTIETTKPFNESTVSKILDLVENASARKAPTENFMTKFAHYYTPIVVFGAMALAVIPPLVIQGAAFSDWIYRALIFLVVSCPCALVISIPLGFFGGIGGASKRGILVKGGNYLEALNHVETVVFDKTGTLTKGVFKVTEINPENGFTAEKLIEYAAFSESYSNHPIAHSIVAAYKNAPKNGVAEQEIAPEEIDQSLVENYEEIAGKGLKVRVKGREVLAGNARLMESEHISYTDKDIFGSVVHVAIDKLYAGSIVISDEVKEDSEKAINDLKVFGIKNTVMLTGDLKSVGEKIGNVLGLDEVYAELLPADKVEKIEGLAEKKSKKGKIAFVGDGINDAPVLARADIGIAMGGLGSDAAIEAADIVIMTDEPSKIVTALKIAKKTRTVVYQNIIFALGIKGIFLLLSAFGLATMWEAVFADTGVAILAVLNAMRVMNTKNF